MVTENCSHNELHEDKHIHKRKVRSLMTEEGPPKNKKQRTCWGKLCLWGAALEDHPTKMQLRIAKRFRCSSVELRPSKDIAAKRCPPSWDMLIPS